MCVCVCVGVKERERESERETEKETEEGQYAWSDKLKKEQGIMGINVLSECFTDLKIGWVSSNSIFLTAVSNPNADKKSLVTELNF